MSLKMLGIRRRWRCFQVSSTNGLGVGNILNASRGDGNWPCRDASSIASLSFDMWQRSCRLLLKHKPSFWISYGSSDFARFWIVNAESSTSKKCRQFAAVLYVFGVRDLSILANDNCGNGREKGTNQKISKEGKRLSNGRASVERSTAGNGGTRYSVIRIDSNGIWEPLSLTFSEMGIHPRDMDLLASSSFIPQRSTIAVRNDKVLVRMENVRAVVCKDFCLLFDARRPRKRPCKQGALGCPTEAHKAREDFASSMADYAREALPNHLQPMPFHLRMIECLLEETSDFFHRKVERLKALVERMLHELSSDSKMGGLQTLLPLKRTLTEVEHDIRDTHQAMEQVLNDDEMLQALFLEDLSLSCTREDMSASENAYNSNQMRRAAADMLLTYLREVDDAGAVLEELRKDMDATQEVWELGLDSTRNRIITTNLYISFATLSLSLATVPASFFGMNLRNGWEEHPFMFQLLVGSISLSSITLGLTLVFLFHAWPRIHDKHRAQDRAALRYLLAHVDDIDDILKALAEQASITGPVSKEEFRTILSAHPSSQSLRQKEFDLLFRIFDRNKDGSLEHGEYDVFSEKMKSGAKD